MTENHGDSTFQECLAMPLWPLSLEKKQGESIIEDTKVYSSHSECTALETRKIKRKELVEPPFNHIAVFLVLKKVVRDLVPVILLCICGNVCIAWTYCVKYELSFHEAWEEQTIKNTVSAGLAVNLLAVSLVAIRNGHVLFTTNPEAERPVYLFAQDGPFPLKSAINNAKKHCPPDPCTAPCKNHPPPKEEREGIIPIGGTSRTPTETSMSTEEFQSTVDSSGDSDSDSGSTITSSSKEYTDVLDDNDELPHDTTWKMTERMKKVINVEESNSTVLTPEQKDVLHRVRESKSQSTSAQNNESIAGNVLGEPKKADDPHSAHVNDVFKSPSVTRKWIGVAENPIVPSKEGSLDSLRKFSNVDVAPNGTPPEPKLATVDTALPPVQKEESLKITNEQLLITYKCKKVSGKESPNVIGKGSHSYKQEVDNRCDTEIPHAHGATAITYEKSQDINRSKKWHQSHHNRQAGIVANDINSSKVTTIPFSKQKIVGTARVHQTPIATERKQSPHIEENCQLLHSKIQDEQFKKVAQNYMKNPMDEHKKNSKPFDWNPNNKTSNTQNNYPHGGQGTLNGGYPYVPYQPVVDNTTQAAKTATEKYKKNVDKHDYTHNKSQKNKDYHNGDSYLNTPESGTYPTVDQYKDTHDKYAWQTNTKTNTHDKNGPNGYNKFDNKNTASWHWPDTTSEKAGQSPTCVGLCRNSALSKHMDFALKPISLIILTCIIIVVIIEERCPWLWDILIDCFRKVVNSLSTDAWITFSFLCWLIISGVCIYRNREVNIRHGKEAQPNIPSSKLKQGVKETFRVTYEEDIKDKDWKHYNKNICGAITKSKSKDKGRGHKKEKEKDPGSKKGKGKGSPKEAGFTAKPTLSYVRSNR